MSDIQRDRFGGDADILSARLAASSRLAPKSPTEALQPESVPPPPPRSQAARHPLVVFLNFVLTVVVIAIVAGGAALFFGKMQFDSPGSLDQARTITIEQGKGLSAISDALQKSGVITSKWLFVAGVWFSRQQSDLKPGEYLIPAHASMRDIMDTLVAGRGIVYSLTIPEGLTSEQVISCMTADSVPVGEDIPGLNRDQEAKCRESAAALTGDAPAPPTEGSILPETYAFSRGDTRTNVLNRMLREHDRILTEVWNRRAPDLPLSNIDELVVLASVVEKETGLTDERSRVAAVFINRLRLNMRLQSDPTVVYGMFGGKGKPSDYTLSKADLETASPYNTYVKEGLPPGPIANPGRASLEAVANPSRTRDLFFVADGSGGHAFAETYEDHLRNVARWREFNANAAAAEPVAAEPDAEAAAEDAATPDDSAADGTEPATGDAAADGPMALTPPKPAPRPAQ
jgi:UPF0755 protein